MSVYKESERDELYRYVEEMQDQTEKLQEENRKLASQIAETESGKQRTISELSSQISMLKKAAQEKSGKITELKNQVKGMEEEKKENDWIRQENEDLTSQNRDLQKSLQDVKKEAKAEVDRVKKDEECEILKIRNQARSENQESQNIYQELKHGYWIMTGALGIYGLFMTILIIWKSAYIRKDLTAVPGMIGKGLLRAWFWLSGLAGHFAGLADKIPVDVLAFILHWVLMIIFIAFVVALFLGICMLIGKGVLWYRKRHNLKVAGVILLCMLSLSFFIGEEIQNTFFGHKTVRISVTAGTDYSNYVK